MSKPFSFGKIDVALRATLESLRAEVEPETPFRIALLGDFSNRANRGLLRSPAEIARLHPVMVDRDNFDEVMRGFGVEADLLLDTTSGMKTILRFTSLEDFHPDRLSQAVPAVRLVLDLRQRLENTKTFPAAAAELRALVEEPASHGGTTGSVETPSSTSDISRLSPSDLLSQIIGEPTSEAKPSSPLSPSSREWHTYLQKLVAPYLTPKANPQQDELVAQVDVIISQQMRALLHNPAFQAVEALWRAVFFLVDRVETSPQLKLYLFDMAQAELVTDLQATENLPTTALYRLLVEQAGGTPEAEPWALVAGNYTFSATHDAAEVLGRVAKIAHQAGAPFLAAADSHLFGCRSLARTPDPDDWQEPLSAQDRKAWQALRHLPESSYLGLAVPRFLLRLPYGRETEPIESFAFEEAQGKMVHETYLWGNPVFACVALLAEAFSQYAWDLRPGVIQNIEGLPLHIYKEDGESVTKPCAETWLTERAVERMLAVGVIPLVSMKDQDVVRLVRWQSLTDPPGMLPGRWKG